MLIERIQAADFALVLATWSCSRPLVTKPDPTSLAWRCILSPRSSHATPFLLLYSRFLNTDQFASTSSINLHNQVHRREVPVEFVQFQRTTTAANRSLCSPVSPLSFTICCSRNCHRPNSPTALRSLAPVGRILWNISNPLDKTRSLVLSLLFLQCLRYCLLPF